MPSANPIRAVAAAALESYFETPPSYAHAGNVADLVLERLPNGTHAWLKPSLKPSTEPAEDEDARWTISERGRELTRRWAAERWLFGQEVSA